MCIGPLGYDQDYSPDDATTICLIILYFFLFLIISVPFKKDLSLSVEIRDNISIFYFFLYPAIGMN